MSLENALLKTVANTEQSLIHWIKKVKTFVTRIVSSEMPFSLVVYFRNSLTIYVLGSFRKLMERLKPFWSKHSFGWLVRSDGGERIDDGLSLVWVIDSRVLSTTAYAEDWVSSRNIVQILDDLFREEIWIPKKLVIRQVYSNLMIAHELFPP
jgi:hypothetical protein